jgi:hypothetical protein
MAYNDGLAGKTFVYSWYRNGKHSGETPTITFTGKVLWDGYEKGQYRHSVKYQKEDGEIGWFRNDGFRDAKWGWSTYESLKIIE